MRLPPRPLSSGPLLAARSACSVVALYQCGQLIHRLIRDEAQGGWTVASTFPVAAYGAELEDRKTYQAMQAIAVQPASDHGEASAADGRANEGAQRLAAEEQAAHLLQELQVGLDGFTHKQRFAGHSPYYVKAHTQQYKCVC